MSLANLFETRSLTWLLTTTAVTRPTTWYLGLSSADPGEDASGNAPPAGGAYARTPVTFTVSGNEASNSASVEFPEATASWGTMSYGTVWDASSGGNMIASGVLRDSVGDPAPVTVGNGQIVRIPANAFKVTVD